MDDQEDKNLVPSQHDAEQEWALEPVGDPEEFGLAKDSRPSKKRIWNRQEVFLAAFAECGKPGVAATNSGISYWTHHHWEKRDIFGYRERLKVAHDAYCQTKIEQMIDDRLENPQGNRGSDVLLMFKAKAEMPDKYREVRDGQQGAGAPAIPQIVIHLPPGADSGDKPLIVDGAAKLVPDEESDADVP